MSNHPKEGRPRNATPEGNHNSKENVPAPNKDYPTKSGIGALVTEVVVLGCGATGLWVLGEHLESHGFRFWGELANFGACVAFFAAVAVTVVKFSRKPKIVWPIFAVISLILACIWVIRHSEPKAEPNIILSLQIDDSTPIPLTNDFLFSGTAFFSREITNGPEVFKGVAHGCLVIPVKPGQSNKVFTFFAENACQLAFENLQAGIAFPKDWKISADAKWELADSFSLYRPSVWVKYPLTNLQAWVSQRSKTFYAWDTIGLPPITNWSISPYTGPQTQAGVVLLQLKAANLDGLFQANVIFFPAQSGFSKPFVARTELTNGLMNVIIPPEIK